MTRLRSRAPVHRVTATRRRVLAIQTSALLVATVVAVPLSPPVTAAAANPTTDPKAPPSVAHDMESATRLAVTSGERVEVLSDRSETGQVFVNPDGTHTTVEYAVPVRVQRGTGWVPVDTTLRAGPDGSVSPTAVPLTVRLSGGGPETPLASLERDGRGLAVSWPGPLPTPVLHGNVATYPEVLPGVDLKITVEPTGFQQVLVVKTRAAAADPALRTISLATRTTGLTLRKEPGGSLAAVDDSGTPVFAAPPPVMWDTPPRAGSRASAAGNGPVGQLPPTQRAMPTQVRDGVVTIRPDQRMLAAPDTNYPVQIDPTWGAFKSAWLHMNLESPNQKAWGWDQNDGGAKVGNAVDTSCCVYRSIFRMPVNSVIHGSTVSSAVFSIDLDHSPSCTKREVQLWETGGINTETTWGNTGNGHWRSRLDAQQGAAYPGCTDPLAMEFSGGLTAYLQRAADSGASEVNVGLRAASESDESQWKKFLPNTAHLSVTYNRRPAVPASLNTVPPMNCGTATSPTAMNTTTPTFTARLRDPDLDNVTGALELLENGAVLRTLTTSPIRSGGVLNWAPVPAGVLAENDPTKVFAFRARTIDTAQATSDQSNTCYFRVDREIPGTPVVESTDFPFGEAKRSFGQVGVLRISPGYGPAGLDTDIAGYRYGFQQDQLTGWVKAGSDGRATIPMVLWTASRTLYVQAVDHAGNPSLEDAPCRCTAHSMAATPSSATPAKQDGDVNGDGLADVSTVFEMAFGRSAAWTFTTTSWNGSYTPYLGWDTGSNGGFPAYRTSQINGDFTGDGLSDIAIFREDPDQKLRLYLGQSDSHRYNMAGEPKWVSPAGWKLSNFRALVGDFDGDGRTDIGGILYTATNAWTGYVWSGAGGLSNAAAWYSAVNTRPIANVRFLAGDYDGDGRHDIAGVEDVGNSEIRFFTYPSTGSAFSQPVQRYTSGAGNFALGQARWVTGNFDGDTGGTAGRGRDDLIAAYDYGGGHTRFITYLFGDTAVSSTHGWDSGAGAYDSTKALLTAGDFNNDGRDDVAGLHDVTASTARLHFFFASGAGLFTAPDLAAAKWSGYIGATAPTFTPEPGKRYRMVASHSGKCLDVDHQSTADSAIVHQYTCQTPGGHQLVTMEPVGNGPYHLLKFTHSGKCLEVPKAVQDNGAGLTQYACGQGGHQQWWLQYLTGVGQDVQVRIRAAHSDKCAEINADGTANSVRAVQGACDGTTGSGQAFHLRIEP